MLLRLQDEQRGAALLPRLGRYHGDDVPRAGRVPAAPGGVDVRAAPAARHAGQPAHWAGE